MSGFSYPQPTFASGCYNPAFYPSLADDGFITYAYAQSLFLVKNDYRLGYITGITSGMATAGTALITDASKNITGIGSLSATSITASGNITSAKLLLGTSTDTARVISYNDSTISNATSRSVFCFGKAPSSKNQVEMAYYHEADGNSSNRLQIGVYGTPSILNVLAGSRVGINKTDPSQALDVSGIVESSQGYRSNGNNVINSSAAFIGGGGVDTTGRVICRDPLGLSVWNSTWNNAEIRLYSMNLGGYCGNYNNSYMYFGTDNSAFITCRKASNGRKATCIGGDNSDLYPLSVAGTTLGDTYSSSGYLNSGGGTGTTPAATAVVAIYAAGRVLATEFNASSDIRLKKDIHLLEPSFAMRFINEIEPKSFLYKNEQIPTYGYIAQELLKHGFYDLVMMHPNDKLEEITDDDGFISPAGVEMSLQSRSVIPLLHLGLKKACAEIEELKKVVAELVDSNKKLRRSSL